MLNPNLARGILVQLVWQKAGRRRALCACFQIWFRFIVRFHAPNLCERARIVKRLFYSAINPQLCQDLSTLNSKTLNRSYDNFRAFFFLRCNLAGHGPASKGFPIVPRNDSSRDEKILHSFDVIAVVVGGSD